MRLNWCQRLIVALVATAAIVFSLLARAQDDVIGRPLPVDREVKRELHDDNGKPDNVQTSEDKRKAKEFERNARGIDWQENPNAKFLDTSDLKKLIEKDEVVEVKFTKPKIEEQLVERGWTKEEIIRLTEGNPSGVSVDERNGRSDPASVYGEKGKYVIVNDITREVVQVSDKTRKWVDDSRIKWN